MRMILGLLMVAVAVVPVAAAADVDIQGAWSTESYVLKDGSEYALSGLIFFTEKDWAVLMFVKDGEGNVRRGSGEGGTYQVDGDALTFTHFYNLSRGEKFGSFDEAPLRMTVREEADGVAEPCRIEMSGDAMTIHFPSGNRIEFTRSSH
jgi:hypothetical protein